MRLYVLFCLTRMLPVTARWLTVAVAVRHREILQRCLTAFGRHTPSRGISTHAHSETLLHVGQHRTNGSNTVGPNVAASQFSNFLNVERCWSVLGSKKGWVEIRFHSTPQAEVEKWPLGLQVAKAWPDASTETAEKGVRFEDPIQVPDFDALLHPLKDVPPNCGGTPFRGSVL